jgi:hypothetical protein
MYKNATFSDTFAWCPNLLFRNVTKLLQFVHKYSHYICIPCLNVARVRGTRWRSCLRHCAKRRKVAGSISDGVIGIFHWHNLSINEYQEYFLVGKGGRYVGLTLPSSYAEYHEIWESQLPGILTACPVLTFTCYLCVIFPLRSNFRAVY